MIILDILRGRPRPGQVVQIVEEALRGMRDDPKAAHTQLARLGPRLWSRSSDAPNIEFGFALRAHAAWLAGDGLGARTDLTDLCTSATTARSLLPLLPLLVSPSPEPANTESAALSKRFGGCGRSNCGHSAPLEAALSVVGAAEPGPDLTRWAGLVGASDEGSPVRIAAFNRAGSDEASDTALSLLNGDHPRLLAARALVAHRERRYGDVIAMLPVGSDLSGRAALALTVGESGVAPSIRELADSFATEHPAAAALLAERDGRWSDAATAWRLAGRHAEARSAAVVADPEATFDPAEIDDATRWFAYAAGGAPRPAGEPTGADQSRNAFVGATRARIRSITDGSPDSSASGKHEILDGVDAVLDRIAESPRQAPVMLSAADPFGPHEEQLARILAATSSEVRTPGPDWTRWLAENAEQRALPRPVAPIAWLADPTAGAAPHPRQLTGLSAEVRLPVLAALVATGARWAVGTAVAQLQPEELASVAPSALPELAPFGHIVAGRRDVDAPARRTASIVASAALANRVARGTTVPPTAEAAARIVSAAISDLPPDPATLAPWEAFHLESEALDSFPTRSVRRAIGPVLHMLTDLPSPVAPPSDVVDLYEDDAVAVMMLRVGRPDEARSAYERGSKVDSGLAAEIAAALAARHLAAHRPYAALRELASAPDPSDFVLLEDGLLERLALAIVRDGDAEGIDQAIEDAEGLLEHLDDMSEIETIAIELLLLRARIRPGSAALDLPDLDRAHEIDPTHPNVARQLAYGLVTRAMETVERDPAGAVRDVDRATDVFMGDHEMAVLSSRIATHAAILLVGGRWRDRNAALRALSVALAINPNNLDALTGRDLMLGRR